MEEIGSISAAELKETGNNHFRNKRYQKAISFYRRGLDICEKHEKHIFYSNLAAVCLRIQNYDLSFEYSKKCVELNPEFEKGYVRLIRSYLGRGEYEIAKSFTLSYISNEAMKKSLLDVIEKLCCSTHYKMSIISPIISPRNIEFNMSSISSIGPMNTDIIKESVYHMFKYNTFVFDDNIFMFGGGLIGGFETNSLLVLEGRKWREVYTKNSNILPKQFIDYKSRTIVFSENDRKLYVYNGLYIKSNDRNNIFTLNMNTLTWSNQIPPFVIEQEYASDRDAGCVFGKLGNTLYIVFCHMDEYGYSNMEPYSPPVDEENQKFGTIFSFDVSIAGDGEWKSKNFPFSSSNIIDLLRLKKGTLFRKVKGKDSILFFWDADGIKDVIIINLEDSTYDIFALSCPNYFLKKRRFEGQVRRDNIIGDNSIFGNRQWIDKIPSLYCQYQDTLLCLHNERYLFKLEFEKMRWIELSSISNFGIIESVFLKKKLDAGKLSLSGHHDQMLGDNERFLDQARRDQIHSIQVFKNRLICFPTSIKYPFQLEEKSIISIRIESNRCLQMKEILLEETKKNTSKLSFCDTLVFHSVS